MYELGICSVMGREYIVWIMLFKWFDMILILDLEIWFIVIGYFLLIVIVWM